MPRCRTRDPTPELGPCKTGNLLLHRCGERRCGARKRLKHRRGGRGQELHGRQPSERRMRVPGTVVVLPVGDFVASVAERSQPVQLQALIAHATSPHFEA